MHVYGELTGNLSAEQTLNGSLSSIINRGVDVVSVDITTNGTYTAPSGKAYSPVNVNVHPPYWCIGKNHTLLRTELKPKVYLKDTDFATWTPSTNTAIIVPTTEEFTFVADMLNYDYMLCIQFYAHLYYDDGAQQKGMFIEGTSESWSAMYRYPSNYAQLLDHNWNTNGANPAIQTVSSTHYYAANGGETVVNSLAYGITCNVQMPTVSSTTGADNPTWTVKSPNIQARCHDSYFNLTNAGYVNQNTSYYQLKYILYRVDYGTCPFRFAQDRKNDILINHGIE